MPIQHSKGHHSKAIQAIPHSSSMTTISKESTPNYLSHTNVTLKFPPYQELMDCSVGDFVTSESFQCGNATFCVKLYPRGGGHRASTTTTTTTGTTTTARSTASSPASQQGFGMSYKVLPMFPNNDLRNQKVGIYLQYLGPQPIIDATFGLRLQGNQSVGRKFDLEWKAGMRFVRPDGKTDLSQGYANDFGAHIMQTPLLQEFMGLSDDQSHDHTPLIANVEVIIHDTAQESTRIGENRKTSMDENDSDKPTSFFGSLGNDIRTLPGRSNKDQKHDGKRVRVGKVVVPILSKLSQRPKMFQQGAYPGVEYRILRILDPHTGKERFTSCPGCEYELKPIYPLVSQLERPWPVRIQEADIPRLYTPNMYNAVSAAGSLLTAITGLATAFLLSQAISFFFIPSRSMDPTLQVGDVLLVDKTSPRLWKNQKPGDIVLFSPPTQLREIVAANGGKLTSRDLFVKRIAGQTGDSIGVDATGRVTLNEQPMPGRRDLCEAEPLRLIEKYVKTRTETLQSGEFFVMGDCSSVSIDSRVWGPLQSSEIVGRPLLRIWPLGRFGTLSSLPPLTTTPTTTVTWED